MPTNNQKKSNRSHLPSNCRSLYGSAIAAMAITIILSGCGDDKPDAGLLGDQSPDSEQEVGGEEVQVDTDDIDASDDEPDVGGEPDADAVDDSLGDGDGDSSDMTETVTFDPDEYAEADVNFPLGVQSGAMRYDSVLLWTFVKETDYVTLRVWLETDTPGEVILVVDRAITPDPAGYVHEQVEELEPATQYQYVFLNGTSHAGFSARSVVGQVRTAPAPGSLDPVTIGAVHGSNWSFMPYTALHIITNESVDMFMHLGDIGYNDSATTLAQYRDLWRDTLSDEGFRAIFSSVGSFLVWDDHEVTNNYDPETMDPVRLETAIRAYFETLAVEQGENGEQWTSYMWGDTAEFILLDCRSERIPSTRRRGDATYIGEEQMAWLQDRLLNSTAHFKVILNSVPITNMPIAWDLAAADRWEGYKAQRDELLSFIVDNEVSNVWFLTGDFHVGFVSHVEPRGDAYDMFEIAVGPVGNGPNPLAAALTLNPQFEFATVDFEIVSIITFDPVANTVRIQYIKKNGEVIYDDVLIQRGG